MTAKSGLPLVGEDNDYDDILCRIKWIYSNIRRPHFLQYDSIDDIEIVPFLDNYQVAIRTSRYYSCDNTTDEEIVYFPYEYLSMENDEIDALFAAESAKEKAERERIDQEKREKERLEFEKWQRKQLLELLNKYGIPDEYWRAR